MEKYLQADPQRARGCYEELQKVRTRLAAALGDARLALLELEEYAGAGIAGKLQGRTFRIQPHVPGLQAGL